MEGVQVKAVKQPETGLGLHHEKNIANFQHQPPVANLVPIPISGGDQTDLVWNSIGSLVTNHGIQSENIQGATNYRIQSENIQGAANHRIQSENIQGAAHHRMQ